MPGVAFPKCNGYEREMAVFRRAPLGFLAAALLLFGFGSFTTAMACPAFASAQDQSDCCDTADCVLLCNLMCHAVAPAAAASPPQRLLASPSFWAEVRALEAKGSGPEPPPPRRG